MSENGKFRDIEVSEAVVLFSDSARGIYVPQHFGEEAARDVWRGVSDRDWAVLEQGPDHEEYWDVWDKVLDNAWARDKEGNVYRLYQDGDVWVLCAERMTPRECRDMFGDDF